MSTSRPASELTMMPGTRPTRQRTVANWCGVIGAWLDVAAAAPTDRGIAPASIVGLVLCRRAAL